MTEKAATRVRQPEGISSCASPYEQVINLQRTVGNQAVQRLFKSGVIQAKLKIGQQNDIYEKEADRVADQVMRMPKNTAISGQLSKEEIIQSRPLRITPLIQRQVEEEEELVQMKREEGGTSSLTSSVESAIALLRGGGKPLSDPERAYFEPRFGADFSHVRVHTGAAAEQSAQDFNAHAYTMGRNIVFGAGRFAPGTHEGQRLIAHELTHVRQQSTGQITEVVQRQPNKDDWSSVEDALLSFARPGDGPRLVFWAKKYGKLPANAGEIAALVSEFYKAIKKNEKGVMEEYDQAQVEQDRSVLEKRRQAARAAEERAAEAKPGLRQKAREQARQQNRPQLYTAIQKAWSERRRYADAELLNQAKSIVAHRIPLPKALLHGMHWKSDQQRWVFIYYYYRENIRVHPELFENPSADDTELLQYAVLAEEDYLETSSKEAEAAELARYRKGIPRAARTEQIKKLAATRPMNPLEDFEPGIHDYAPYQGQPQSVNVDIVGRDFDADNITIEYSGGKELEIPLGKKDLLFPNKPLDPSKVLRIFTRRHKKSQRLIPFVIYENTLGVDLDILSEEDLALMGLPRFDPVLTPDIVDVLSPEFKMHKATLGALKVASLHAAGLGFRQLGVPLVSGALGTGYTLVTGAVRTGRALTSLAAKEISFAVTAHRTWGATVTYLAGRAMTLYRMNAVQINTASFVVTDIAISLGGGDTGGMSVGDEVSMVVADVKEGTKAVKNSWKLIEAEVKEVNLAAKQAKLHVNDIRYIEEKTAKVEYDLGKKMALLHQPAGKGKGKAVQGIEEELIKTGKLASYTFEHGGHAWPILKDGSILRCSKWCTPASVEEAFGDLIKAHPHLTAEMTKIKKLKGKARAEAATNLGNRLERIRNAEGMPLDDLEKLLAKPEFTKGTLIGNDLHFVRYQKKGGKLGFEDWQRMEMKLNLPPAKLSERDAGMVVKNQFPSSDWVKHPLYLQGEKANKIGGRNPLGSSEPEWYSKALNAAVEVKRKDFIARLDSVDWNQITRQLEQRIRAMPTGTKNWIMFDIRRQPVSVAEVSILPKLSSNWDEIFFLTDNGLLKIVGKKAVPVP